MKAFLLLVLLLCFPHQAEAQVDFSLLEQEYPGPDQGWLPTLIVPYPSETVNWEFPLFPSDAGRTGPRVFIQSGPLTIIFDEKGEGQCLIGKKEILILQRDLKGSNADFAVR